MPVEVLSFLPPSEPDEGSLSVGSSPLYDPTRIENVRGLDAAYFIYTGTSAKSVTYQ